MNWELIEGFQKREFAPREPFPFNWDMDYNLVLTLHGLRRKANKHSKNPVRFVIRDNGGFAVEGHSPQSLHGRYIYGMNQQEPPPETYLGRAADFTIEEKIGALWTPWSWLKQAAFVYHEIGPEHGLGIYPWWHRPGLHLDWRVENHERTPAIWTRFPDGHYCVVTFDRFYELADIILNFKGKSGESFAPA